MPRSFQIQAPAPTTCRIKPSHPAASGRSIHTRLTEFHRPPADFTCRRRPLSQPGILCFAAPQSPLDEALAC